jgi:hypothetical protein
MGFRTPEVAIIEISDSFYSNMEISNEIHDKLRASPGKNFGSKEIDTIFEFIEIPRHLKNRAAEIFAFDTVIGNIDRNKIKPNLFQESDDYTIFDHEKAFYYSNPGALLGQNPKFWEDPNSNIISMQNHLFYNELKGSRERLDISTFIESLSLLSEEILYNIVDRIPEEWKSEDLDSIIRFLLDASINAQKIEQILMEVLK